LENGTGLKVMGFSLVAVMDNINLVHFVRPPGRLRPVIDVLIDGYNSADIYDQDMKRFRNIHHHSLHKGAI
jgi:hypothetical protein